MSWLGSVGKTQPSTPKTPKQNPPNSSWMGGIGNSMSGLFGQMQNQLPPTPPPAPKAEAGTLLIKDSFTRTRYDMSTPHGHTVFAAAKETGFSGNVQVTDHTNHFNAGDRSSATASIDQENKFAGGALKKDEARSLLANATELNTTNFMDSQSSYLEQRNDGRVKNSAVNMSLGSSKAQASANMYMDATNGVFVGKENRSQEQQQSLENYATAFDVDLAKLENKDQKINGPEHKKLQQGIVDFVSETVDTSPAIKGSKQRWDKAVNSFESHKNSVVVSAGNEGDYDDQLQQLNGGQALNTPKDFEKNYLENSAVTSVGATEGVKVGDKIAQKPAAYSNRSGGVDIYSTGDTPQKDAQGNIAQGTSFASPDVAATMAQIHKNNPDMNSAQVENLMKNRLSSPMNSGSGTISVLDMGRTQKYMAENKF